MPEPRRPVPVALFVAVMLVAVALHARAIGFGFSFLDDDRLIVDQQAQLAAPSNVWRAFARPYFPPSGRDHAYYRPLVTVSYGLDASWTGDRPHGYHLTNVLLAALAAGLLFRLLIAFGYGSGIALFGALLYAVHPALAETVAWIPGRPDALVVVFALAAWLLLARARETERWTDRIAHLLAWLAALLCKEVALVLPLAYAGHLILVERRPLRRVLEPWLVAGWAGVLLVYFVARAVVLSGNLGAAGVTVASWTSSPAFLLGSLGKLALPIHLAVLATPEDSMLWPGLVAAAALVAIVMGTLRGFPNPPAMGRGEQSSPAPHTIAIVPGMRRTRVLFAIGCFIAFVLPGLPASRVLLLESRLALPAIAIVLVACEVAHRLDAWPRVRPIAGGVLIAGLAAVSFVYAGNFRDRLTFAQAAVRGSPHAALAHRNLGVAYHLAGQTPLARLEYQAAVADDPTEPVVHNNLAVLLMAEGRLPEAEQELRTEIAVNPDYAVAHDNLARVLRALGRPEEAAGQEAIAASLGARAD